MKKKTSLWISGITTVAMLAVAVGSFAAWDTLSSTATGLTVSTNTPTTITAVKDDSVTADTEKLIPTDGTATVFNKTGAKAEVKVGAVNISAKGLPASGSEVVFVPTIKKAGGTEDVTDKFKVTLKASGGSAIEKNTNITDLSENAKSFDVNVAFAEDADTADINKLGSLEDMTIEIKVTAQTVPAP